jgi:hypothetical protein
MVQQFGLNLSNVNQAMLLDVAETEELDFGGGRRTGKS